MWDVAILIPNLLFLGFLCILFQRARIKLYATNSPVFLCFYGMIWICAIFSVLRSVISMGLSSAHVSPATQDVANRILWTVVRFVLLTAEISVLIFSLAFGHLESRHSIRAVLITTGIISLAYSVVQGQFIIHCDLLHCKINICINLSICHILFTIKKTTYSFIQLPGALELLKPSELGVFGHGGVIFLLTTSAIFTLLYLAVYLLPYTRISNVISIPAKPSFYRYALVLFANCLSLTTGSALVLLPLSFAQSGYCLINLSHYLYYTFFTPLVYMIYLNDYCYQPAKIPFSYTLNESMYEDNVNSIDSINTYLDDDNSFMHHPSGSGGCQPGVVVPGEGCLSAESGPGERNPNNFVLNGPVYTKGLRSQDQINYHRFLYNTNIQSPGTGYSSVEESTTATVSAHGSMEFIQEQQHSHRHMGSEEDEAK